MTTPPVWRIERFRADAAAAHADMPLDQPVVRVIDLVRPALVLGSRTDETIVDRAACAEAGIDVVRRRSGGGLVLLEPGDVCWIDVVVPRGHPEWSDDVSVAMHWIGRAWSRALEHAGVVAPNARLEVHTGTLVSNEWSKLVCFAGLGPGEVVLDGQKVVGVSQRRTRVGARLQTTALGAWRPDRLVALTRLDREQAAVARLDITPRAVGVGRSPAALADAFVASIG